MNRRLLISLAFGLVIFLFWWLAYPHALSYQEQNQLFLLTGDYLMERISVAGGLADYIGEGITQFFLIPWLGALLLALIFVALQSLAWRTMRLSFPHVGISDATDGNSAAPRSHSPASLFMTSFFPSVLLLWLMGDENVLPSYPVALVLTLLCSCLMRGRVWWVDLAVIPFLYWCTGPVAWLYVCLRVLRLGRRRAWLLAYMGLVLLVAENFFLVQWPTQRVWMGLNYYRIPQIYPILLFIVPLVILLLAALAGWGGLLMQGRAAVPVVTAVLAAMTYLALTQGFDVDKYELLRQDYLIRNERWDDIIERAEKHVVKTSFWSQSVNLALAMRRQLAERQFEFYQSGEDALLAPAVHDNTSGWPTAEAFWRLGMVNSAQRYFFETQNAILNDHYSGRCMKRLAECAIVNGQYGVARKYLNLLKKTLFYRKWAEKASEVLYRDDLVARHPVYGNKRSRRFTQDFLYSSRIMDQMLGLLFAGHHDNKMALDYMMAQLLLNGNTSAFARSLVLAERYGGYQDMPSGYQEVVRCLQGSGVQSNYLNYINRMNHRQQ